MKNRSIFSFSVLFIFVALVFVAWHFLKNDTLDEGQPRILRGALEFNGGLWSKFFDLRKTNQAKRPPPGRAARVNGKVGLEDGEDDEDEEWSLEVDPGRGKKPFEVSLSDLKKLPHQETSAQLRCIEGWAENMSFGGVRFSDFMLAFGLEKQKYVGFETPDGEYYVSIDMESLMHEQTLLAYEQNGAPLTRDHGAPLRLAIPIKYGIKNIKHIGRIFFSDQRPPDYWAERGYDWYAGL